MICGSGGSKSRLAKAARAEPSGQMRDEKLHAVVARSTFGSKNTSRSDHFWKFRCRFAWQMQGIVHLVTSEQDVGSVAVSTKTTALHITTLHYTPLQSTTP